jgi:polysaccharide biosynthesis/export protein ExoF
MNYTTSYSVRSKLALVLASIAAALAAGPGGSKASEAVRAGEQTVDTASNGPSPQATPDANVYRLNTGDRLRIRFYDRYDRDDLNGEYVINENGRLRLPRIGIFYARDKTTVELERDISLIAERMGEKLSYFSIDIAQCRPFYVAGYANHPGSYSFVPGFTVLHAVSLAGGLYHSPAASITEAMREKSRLIEMLGRMAELIAQRARLQAESEGVATIQVPKELTQLAPARASEMIASEQNLLLRSREVADREKLKYETIVALTKCEAESFQKEIARIEPRVQEIANLYEQLKKLYDEKVINQQRLVETLAALDAAQRDRQAAITGLSRANTDLERAGHDLSMFTLANNARLAKETAETDKEIVRLKMIAAETRKLMSGLDVLGGTAQSVAYRIMRHDKAGHLAFMQASEMTPIMPGDLIQIESQKETQKEVEATE